MSALVTRFLSEQLEKLDIPPIPEFIGMIADSGTRLFACKASVEMVNLDESDLVPQVGSIVTIGEFYEMAAGGEMIFT